MRKLLIKLINWILPCDHQFVSLNAMEKICLICGVREYKEGVYIRQVAIEETMGQWLDIGGKSDEI